MQRLICVAFLPLLLLLAGCKTHAPMIQNHQVTFQKKLQAVQHWKVLASDLVKGLQAHDEFSGKTVYVDVLQSEPEFSQALGKLVISALTEKGFQVVSAEQGADFKLIIGTQAVFHGRRYGFGTNATEGLGALALGFRNLLAGDNSGSPGQTRGELLVTSWVHQKNRVLYCNNQIAYVPVKDAALYLSDSELEQLNKAEASRTGLGSWFSSSFRDDSLW